jgi:hypothetical protein
MMGEAKRARVRLFLLLLSLPSSHLLQVAPPAHGLAHLLLLALLLLLQVHLHLLLLLLALLLRRRAAH